MSLVTDKRRQKYNFLRCCCCCCYFSFFLLLDILANKHVYYCCCCCYIKDCVWGWIFMQCPVICLWNTMFLTPVFNFPTLLCTDSAETASSYSQIWRCA